MCRRAFKDFRSHFVCVSCRNSKKSHEPTPCEFCHVEMYDAGEDFKPPRKTDNNGWKKVEILFNNRGHFGGGCCGGNGCGIVGVDPTSLGSLRRTAAQENAARAAQAERIGNSIEYRKFTRTRQLEMQTAR